MLVTGGEKKTLERRLGSYIENLGAFYGEVRDVTGASVTVDSSESFAYGFALGNVPEIDPYIVHLVGDPWASAYSWPKKKLQADRGEDGYMDRFGPAKAP